MKVVRQARLEHCGGSTPDLLSPPQSGFGSAPAELVVGGRGPLFAVTGVPPVSTASPGSGNMARPLMKRGEYFGGQLPGAQARSD